MELEKDPTAAQSAGALDRGDTGAGVLAATGLEDRVADCGLRERLPAVGDTDSVGELNANLQLSRAWAKTVVDALIGKWAVAATRLNADGVGPLAPVAANRADEGRTKNRRVELVDLSTQ